MSTAEIKPLKKKELLFLILIILTGIFLFGFVFWLGYPGYFQEGDIFSSLWLAKNNWHPVIIPSVLEVCYSLFGRHTYYLFFINVFCFYIGIIFFITALYLRFRSSWFLCLFGLTFIGNLFFQNFIQYDSFTQPMLMWLALSIVFFMILVPLKIAWLKVVMIIVTSITFLFALFWRHNAIVSIFPLFVFFIHVFLSIRHSNSFGSVPYLLKFVGLMMVSAILLILMVSYYPFLFSKNINKNTARHIFLHQIAGAVVPANDSSLIPKEWYEEGKTFEDVKELYKKEPLLADTMGVPWEPWKSKKPFKFAKLPGLKKVWIKSILKYPRNYLIHEARFFRALWFGSPYKWILNAQKIQETFDYPWHVKVKSTFDEDERKITFTPIKEKIYNSLYQNRVVLNHIYGVSLSFILVIASGVILVFFPKRYSYMLSYSFSVALSASASAIIFCVFSPAVLDRYLSPILPLAIISLLGFVTFILETRTKEFNMSIL